MKRIAILAAAFVFILLLTKIANQVPPPAPSGVAFWLKAQTVVQCNATEITMVDPHQKSTHLEKDDTWPDCSSFQAGKMLDFELSRGAKTRFLSMEQTAWWRKAL
jgi:hypothetical protein